MTSQMPAHSLADPFCTLYRTYVFTPELCSSDEVTKFTNDLYSSSSKQFQKGPVVTAPLIGPVPRWHLYPIPHGRSYILTRWWLSSKCIEQKKQ